MYEIDTKLLQLEREGRPIRVALIGAGQMGKDIVAQIAGMNGMECDVVVDLNYELAKEAYRQAGYPDDQIVIADTPEEIEAASAAGKKAVSVQYKAAVRAGQVQCVIDATGSPEMGARVSMECIFHKKHIVMMNVECDITIGPILRKLSEQAGIVYSLTAGDEPGSVMEIIRFAKALGFKIVAAGKGKNNPLDIYANPGMKEWADKAAARDMSPRMLIEFVDGSKTMIEMAAVSNATGLTIDCHGMHGPHCNVADLTKVFSLKSQGGILDREGVVDYGIGNINPGVFVVVTTDNKRIIDGLVQRDMGTGPNYLLYRPYHLCSIETPLTAAQAVIYGESSAHPLSYLTSECVTAAKKDLKAGEKLDAIGEYCYRAEIETAAIARAGKLLPVGLAKGARVICDIPRDTPITYDMVELDEGQVLLQLRWMQDQMLAAEESY
ncbi:MAG: SAF domain-containing protein [Oscillospiraceae bacterium]|jgi:predicted homoserine dehydrogenase-like protein|nr:SAF domain-containing protein [Oscillospiraceae bacterium]